MARPNHSPKLVGHTYCSKLLWEVVDGSSRFWEVLDSLRLSVPLNELVGTVTHVYDDVQPSRSGERAHGGVSRVFAVGA